MSDQILPDSDHVSRYCKPSTVQDGKPIVGAFLPRPKEKYLSVNWLDHLDSKDLDAAIEGVPREFNLQNYSVRFNGRFAVLNVGRCRRVSIYIKRPIKFINLQLDNSISHAGMVGIQQGDFSLATEIISLIDDQNVHPAIP